MKQIIRLTENDIRRLVNEAVDELNLWNPKGHQWPDELEPFTDIPRVM